MNLTAQNYLSAYLAIPFGIGYRQLKEGSKGLTAFFDAIRQPLISAFVTSVRMFSPSINAASGDAKKMAKLATSSGALLANALPVSRRLSALDTEQIMQRVASYAVRM